MSEYPEHDRLKLISDKSQAIGEFLDWLEAEKGILLGEWGPTGRRMYPFMRSKVDLLAEHFEIDQSKIDAEKREMLNIMREANRAVAE